jgi:hypothetical protein
VTGSILLVAAAAIAVAVALAFGLRNMMSGGSALTSQKLMRMRVTLQALAVLIIMVVLWWHSGSGA